MIYKTKLLQPAENGTWQWDAEKIDQLDITDNVVDLMAEKIALLDEQARETIQMCACVGTRFDLEAVGHLLDRPVFKKLYMAGGFNPRAIMSFGKKHGIIINCMVSDPGSIYCSDNS